MQLHGRLVDSLLSPLRDATYRRQIYIFASVFGVIYFLAILYLRNVAYRDPTSAFFSPAIAYNRRYSSHRQVQAEDYVFKANDGPPFHRSNTTGSPPRLCVGIPSVARNGASYLPVAVGSLLEGLTQPERDGLHLIVFIAVSTPEKHPAFNEPWLSKLADQVLVYNLLAGEFDHIVALEQEKALFREKGLFDYNYLLKECISKQAPYIAMFEDDVVAMDGWYHRTLNALQDAARRSGGDNFLYLRLFYTEEFLGWNSEEARTHIAASLLIVAGVAIFLGRLRVFVPAYRRYLNNTAILLICVIPVPLAILLFFASGRVTVMPVPAGVSAMNRYGCCSQGLVFPYEKAGNLTQYYKHQHTGFVDVLTENYANEHREQRWALTPSVIQHVGRKSSKGDDLGEAAKYNRPVAEKIWNFAFELNDVQKLRKEHDLAANVIL